MLPQRLASGHDQTREVDELERPAVKGARYVCLSHSEKNGDSIKIRMG